ncbi:cytochrome c5 family protein [Hahella sp. CCB-MM4]|uniref:c-type cytochrome n=1 Tax=Hahella sp. (strain CCB-MM4) TaxID=1926491 RepID=UPI000B9ABF69|nr:c-type cytochrome [Hahella sp. CCB-MM4]OZG71160.1 cytochrome c5 family protein [Hahella sp. CCB-MM4]
MQLPDNRLGYWRQFSINLLIAALATLGLAGCSGGAENELVSAGKTVWEANCRVCHQQGLGGAPMIGNQKQWAPRIAQGVPVLIEHATQGYSGATGVMPPRGGNPDLPDEQLKLAVAYMVSQSR